MSGDDRQNSPSISRQNRPSATQKLFQGKCIPVSEHGGNSSCEYEVAVEKLCKIAENLRQYGVPEELISALDKAENEILALEEERMFRFAIRYRAELQRELM